MSIKILYIITQADGGGAQQYVLELAKHFNGAIAAGEEASELFDTARKAGLETFKLKHLKRRISPWHDYLAALEIRRLVEIYQPEIVHLNSTKAGILGSFAALMLKPKPKIIFTAHGFVFNEPKPWALRSLYVTLEKIASEHRDFIIAVSERDRETALTFKLIAPEKIAVVYNGIDTIDFLPSAEARQTLRLPADKFIFGTVANFYKTKGLDVLVEAATLMTKDALTNCEFILIGDGPELKNLKFKIQNSKLEDTIKTRGQINDAQKYLKAFNAFVLPSRKEGFPYAILEALQAGLPIVASDVGGIKEALGKAGILVEPGNPTKLANKLGQLMQDQNLRESLAQRALAQAPQFTLEKMLDETKKIYNRVLD